tara:strand:+ start:523 stop:768 length:246 start_codon:yes stop_codon:yes gene_type:complete
MDYLEIPAKRLQTEVLQAVLEEFINREGTDYGETELSMDEKLQGLKELIDRGEVCIVFDPQLDSCTLMKRDDFEILVDADG